GAAGRLVRGLRADALYFSGGAGVLEAQRAYRELAASGPEADEAAWRWFRVGTTHQGLGFGREAETAYQTAASGPPGPWTAALVFDQAVLALEAGRHAEARERLLAWLARYPREPGRALVLALAGECDAALGDPAGALSRFDESRRLDGAAWLVRPQAGFALAGLLRQAGRPGPAVEVLDALAASAPGTAEAARARLEVGSIWEAEGKPGQAARAYARILDEGPTPDEGREALLRLALLGVAHGRQVKLTEALPGYRVFYRPRPTLEEFAAGREPQRAQRAQRGLASLARADGDVRGALVVLARAFRDYPESPESGRAYEEFMGLLEAHLAERLAAGAHGEVVELYEALRGPMGWAATRDTGAVAARAAEAYEGLGAPASARRVYEAMAARGTRYLAAEELGARVVRTRAREGDLDALRERVGRDPGWEARRDLARALDRGGDPGSAARLYREAAEATPGPAQKLAALAEADRLAPPGAPPARLLEGLEVRRGVWRALPPGAERDTWEAHGRIVEARLRFSAGDWAGVVRAFGSPEGLAAADAYLLALAESRSGRPERARQLWSSLASGSDPTFSPLATLQLQVLDLLGRRGAL
ncbi:MAG: tetratricopeptide repeat protein, partial [Deferrisomatales bacterium]